MPSVLACLAGLMTSLAFAPFSFVPGIVLGPALLLLLLSKASSRKALYLGWVFGFSHFVSGVWWVLISTWVFGGAPLPLALLLLAMLAAYLGLFPALSAGLFVFLRGHSTVFAALSLWPLCWLAGEFLRATVLHGFPWFSLGYVASDVPNGLNLAAVVGVHGVSAVYALVAIALSRLFVPQGRVLAGLALLAVVLLHAVLPKPSDWTQVAGDDLSTVLIQGNISQDQKWLAENRMPTVELYEGLTREAWPADLVIWPEVAIPLPHAYVTWLFDLLDMQASDAGGTLYAGVLTQQDGRNFNTVYALGEDEGRYVKSHLVPFGEYIPAPDWLKPLFDVLGLPFPEIASQGMSGQSTLSVNGYRVSMSICFEDVFPMEVRRTSVDSAFLVNVTNDAWFAGSAAPQQHLQIARLRAAESGRSLLRVANTGVSAVIDADGQVSQQLGWGQRGLLRASVTPRQGLTPYQQWGRSPLLFVMFAGLLLAGVLRWSREKREYN